jgi:hypothetical protein
MDSIAKEGLASRWGRSGRVISISGMHVSSTELFVRDMTFNHLIAFVVLSECYLARQTMCVLIEQAFVTMCLISSRRRSAPLPSLPVPYRNKQDDLPSDSHWPRRSPPYSSSQPPTSARIVAIYLG